MKIDYNMPCDRYRNCTQATDFDCTGKMGLDNNGVYFAQPKIIKKPFGENRGRNKTKFSCTFTEEMNREERKVKALEKIAGAKK